MSSFMGSYRFSVDGKGRLSLPAWMRKTIPPDASDIFVINRGFDECLYVYPQDEWHKVEETLRQLSDTDSQHRHFRRMFYRFATEVRLDSQSRISIPRELMALAKIEGEVLIHGVSNHIELWNPKIYDAYLTSHPETWEDVAQKLFKH